MGLQNRCPMKQMINLALRTEFSFQKTYGYLEDVVATQDKVVGVADIENTFAHFYLDQECKKQNKKAIFGVRLMVVKNAENKVKPRGQYGPEYIFLAKNHEGLMEIHDLVERSIECMYFRRHIGLVDVWKLSENVIVITHHFEMDERIDYIALNHMTSPVALASDIPKVAIVNNQIVNAEDKEVYQLFAGKRKTENWTYPTHILSTAEWFAEFGDEEAINNTHVIADQCNVVFPEAEPVKYKGDRKIKTWCRKGAKKLGIDLKDPVYKERLKFELDLIREKDFIDYFLIVAEMVEKAKEYQLVGPGRGSSGGSLVCFLMGITTLDPIKWDLLFARFIDLNRDDMPDIDIDFPDTKRQSVIDELVRTNGKENVKNIGTISEMRTKGAIGDFAKELGIEPDEVEAVKNSIVEVSSGDARFGESLKIAFEETEIGKLFIEKYPNMKLVERIEQHSRHSGIHAAGVIVSSRPIKEFASINPSNNTMQLEGKPAETMGLLKMDCLGLANLSILEEVAALAGFDFRKYYDLEYNDDSVFKLFRDKRLKGIFQFEGPALSGLCRTIKVRHIEDIVAITALARPGPLHGGGAAKFSKIHQGLEEIEYVMDDPDIERITKKTMGVIVYQEQVMQIMRDVGGFPWKKVGTIRKLVSKKGGKEQLDKFRIEFIEGAVNKGLKREDVEEAWRKILEFAAYGFNRSHSVAYGMVSYWTAWAKTHYPLEFLVANLNSGGAPANKKRLIREMKKHHEFELISFDYDLSEEKWTLQDGNKIVGSLTNVDGIGVANAKVIMRKRENGEKHAAGIAKKLENPVTKFDIIYPCEHYWGGMFRTPSRYGLYEAPTTVENITEKGDYLLVAQLMKKNVRDLNELQNVLKRGGEVYEDNTKLLNITVEDDTGSIMCRVNRFDYEKLGVKVAEEGEEEKDWYLIKGRIISDDIIFLFISEIFKLGDGYSEGETIRDI